jgi:hypothetical protein
MSWLESWLQKLKLIKKSEPKSETTSPVDVLNLLAQKDQLSLEDHQEHSELERIKNSKGLLQCLDELITSNEADIDKLSSELDKYAVDEEAIKKQVKEVNAPNSWKERNLLLKLERLLIQKQNSQQRLEIYNQNIRVCMNMVARIQDMDAMKMGGINETKIEDVWLDFKTHFEQYKDRILHGEVSEEDSINVTSIALERRLHKLRNEIFGVEEPFTESVKTQAPIKTEMPEKLVQSEPQEKLRETPLLE